MCPPYACRPAGLGGFFGQRVHGWLSHAAPLGLIFGNIATAVPRMGIPVMLFLGQEPCPRNVKKNDSESRGTSTTLPSRFLPLRLGSQTRGHSKQSGPTNEIFDLHERSVRPRLRRLLRVSIRCGNTL